jgi:fucose 4-O-acetylase-like acetyltransferase
MRQVTFERAWSGHGRVEARFVPDHRERMPSTLALTRPQPTSSAQPTPATESAPAPPASRRDPWFDNAKMLLVTLVVVGHSLTLLPHGEGRHTLYYFLYLWHMPAFVMVTGYLSRSFTWSPRKLGRLVTTVAVPYVVFEAALSTFRAEVGGEGSRATENLFIEPHWPMWFLAVLFLWRLATPVLKAAPSPLVLAVLLSLVGGVLDGDTLDIGRALGMLPFFALGLHARREHLDLLRSGPVRVAAGVVVALAALASLYLDDVISTEWLYYRSGYGQIGVSFAEGVATRLFLLLFSGVVALSVLALVPRFGGWFARLGAATMVVYLFHGFFVKGAIYVDAFSWAPVRPHLALLTAVAASVVLALALAAPPVARRLNVLVDPVGAALRRLRARKATAEDQPAMS